MSQETTVLELRGIDVRFGGNHVLQGVDLDVGRGFTGLLGPNGAGKTTIFNVISGYVRQHAGEVLLEGVSLSGKSATSVARHGVGRTFQTPKLVPDMTLLDNVLLGVDGRRHLGGRKGRARALELLGLFGLADHRSLVASAIPLASQKVVEVIRAVVSSPRLVLLDEPAAGLSAGDVASIIPPLREVVAADQLAVVIIEHDVELVARLCPRAAVLHFGRTLAVGTPAEVMRHPDVLEAYLGADFAAVDS